MNEVAKSEVVMLSSARVGRLPTAAASEAAALIGMIERASTDPAIDIERVERMYAMYERAAARNARAAYDSAMSEMQPQMPVIGKRGKGHNDKTYARWEDIAEGVLPILAAHGFALTFRVKRSEALVEVTAILSHRDGHREETTLTLPIDASGNKNPVQAIGSSTSYGKRYAAGALLNIVARDEDDDARAAGSATISEDDAEKIKTALETTGASLPRFCAYWKLEKLTDLPAAKLAAALRSIEESAKRRQGRE